MMLRNSTEMDCCCPFCCLGTLEPSKLALFTIVWDMFILFSWFVYNMTMLTYVTIAPLIINFGYILFMFIVLWDLREPNGKFIIVKYYSYFRVVVAILMSMFAITNFILIFVYIANSSLQGTALNLNWAIAFFLYFTPASVIQWGTPMSELTSGSRFANPVRDGRDPGYYGNMSTPRGQFKV